MAMDLYLSNCYNTAQAAAAKAAASSLTADREQCDSVSGGQSVLLRDPGLVSEGKEGRQMEEGEISAESVIKDEYRAPCTFESVCLQLYQPSYDFNLTDSYCQLLETSYKSLHEPHLKIYSRRKDILRRLKKGGYITSNNKVVCTLKELNKYRQYLTSLKLDFERNYIREQKMIEKQVNKLYETKRACDNYDNTQFQRLAVTGKYTNNSRPRAVNKAEV
ncbi:hypothetical protein EI555_004816 [Monodon monoceros]|uniref:Uncharacterized protein n=1 Tax=Monodon monoceros TaxID=40151 RepID=A0A4U1EUQ9_MONMO|nr:hypothetical protein EI555_004816 [Monodon monoceros]